MLRTLHNTLCATRSLHASDSGGVWSRVWGSPDLDTIAETFYTQLPQPLVIDARWFEALAARSIPLAAPGGPRVLTPHPGEFMRLVQTTEKTFVGPTSESRGTNGRRVRGGHRTQRASLV